jgi:hypothetical protein
MSAVAVLIVELRVTTLMIGLAALDGVTFGRRNPNVTTCAPDRLGRIICFGMS